MERRVVEFLIQGKSNREICRELKMGDRKVARVRALAEGYGYLSGQRKLPAFPEMIFSETEPSDLLVASDVDKQLLINIDWIRERLELGWSPVTVWEELSQPVGRSSFYRFLIRHRLDRIGEKSRVIPEIVHRPGEALILDWGKLVRVTDDNGKSRIVWAFVGVMGFSRYMMVRLVWTNDVPTTIHAIESMLKEIGGVPERMTSDNPKCFAIEASKYEPLLNPVFERWAAHSGITVECLPPYDPQKKGKVERQVPYTRRLFEAHGEWAGLEEAQAYIDKKVLIANQRRHGTTTLRPLEVFAEIEQKTLKPLPTLAYEIEEFHHGPVRRDGFVRFRNKYYSVGSEYVGKDVVVIGDKEQVSVYLGGKLLEVHARITDPHISKSTKPYHLKPHERVMQDGALYLKRAEKIGPFTVRIVGLILAQGAGFVDTRKVWGILSLDKSYSNAVIDKACEQALALSTLSYRSVHSLCRLQPQGAGPETIKNASPKFARKASEYKQMVFSINQQTGVEK